MKIKQALYLGVAVAALGAFVAVAPKDVRAQTAAVTIDGDDIGGVVRGPNGPEAGVWVIAETNDLPTKFTKIVVTDDQGRYVIPDLPKANYMVWVRGYGLVDSRQESTRSPARSLNITAMPAPNAAAAAEYYPAMYWYSMLKIPPAERISRHRPEGQRHPDHHQEPGRLDRHDQEQRLPVLPRARHQGVAHDLADARRSSRIRSRPGSAASSPARPWPTWPPRSAAWARQGAIELFADWTDRIAAGELPFAKPAAAARHRAQRRDHACGTGARRSIYMHDADLDRQAQSDRQCLRPDLRLDGRELRLLPGAQSDHQQRLHDQASRSRSRHADRPRPTPLAPSVYWGDEAIWDGHTSIHNPMMDEQGGVWFTARIRPAENPAFCQAGSDHPSAKVFPLKRIDPPARRSTIRRPASGR